MNSIGNSRRSLVLGTALVLLLIGVTSFLFRGWLQQGMQMDEVNRVINVIPLLNERADPIHQSTFTLNFFGVAIPLMYKEYISTACTLRFLPLAFFNDYLFGLRALYWIYFVASAIILFLVLRSKQPYMATFAPLLMVTAPLYYPEIRIGFADSLHVLFLALGCHLLSRFVSNPDSRSSLFWGAFLLFFAANQMLYFSWVIVGMTLATLLLYPDLWFQYASSLRNWIVFIFAASLGMTNFLVYNVMSGFPTVSIFFKRIFLPEEYNKRPLDYAKTKPFLEDIGEKVSQVPNFLGPHWKFFVAVTLLSFLVVLCCSLKWTREGRLRENRIYLLPFLGFSLILVLILISPKTTRAGHYVYVVPFLQIAVLTSVLLVGNLFKSRHQSRLFVVGVPILLVGANFVASNQIVTEINRTGGTGLYSPAVFEFTDYLTEQKIDARNVVFLTWGLHTQPYFLNKGDFRINQLVFRLIDESTKEEKRLVLKYFFSSSKAQPEQGNRLYFPLYAQRRGDINEALIDLVESYGGTLKPERVFKERTGEDVIVLYRLDDVRNFTASFHDEIGSAAVSQNLRIIQFGPMREEAGRSENLPMWFIAKGLTPHTKVTFDGLLLDSVYSVDHITALVPVEKIKTAGFYPLFLYDLEKGIRSEPVHLEIN